MCSGRCLCAAHRAVGGQSGDCGRSSGRAFCWLKVSSAFIFPAGQPDQGEMRIVQSNAKHAPRQKSLRAFALPVQVRPGPVCHNLDRARPAAVIGAHAQGAYPRRNHRQAVAFALLDQKGAAFADWPYSLVNSANSAVIPCRNTVRRASRPSKACRTCAQPISAQPTRQAHRETRTSQLVLFVATIGPLRFAVGRYYERSFGAAGLEECT